MSYVFDTSSLSKLKHFFPGVFKSVWTGLDGLVQAGELISTREVWNEIERGDVDPHTNQWLNVPSRVIMYPFAAGRCFDPAS